MHSSDVNVGGPVYLVGGVNLPVKFSKISLTTTAAVVSAVAGKKIRVLDFYMECDTTTGDETYVWASDPAGTPVNLQGVSLVRAASATAPIVLQSPVGNRGFGLFESATGAALGLVTAGTTPIARGYLTYVEVPA